MKLFLPVRFTGDQEDKAIFSTLELDITDTALLLVDFTYDNPPESGVGQVLRTTIAPTLDAVRSIGMRILFFAWQ